MVLSVNQNTSKLDVHHCNHSHSISIKSHFTLPLNGMIDWLFTACMTLCCPRSISSLHTPSWVCIIDFLPAIWLPGHRVTFNDLSTWQYHIHHSLSPMTDLNSNANMKWRLTSTQIGIYLWADIYQHRLTRYMEKKICVAWTIIKNTSCKTILWNQGYFNFRKQQFLSKALRWKLYYLNCHIN